MNNTASFFRRLISTIIDTIIVFIVMVPFLIPFMDFDDVNISYRNDSSGFLDLIEHLFGSMILFLVITFGVMLVAVLIYYVIIPLFTGGRTIGRVLTKTRVVTKDDTRAGFKILFVREVIMNHIVVPLLNILLVIAAVVIIFVFKRRGRTIGDIVAGTKTINTKKKK